MIVFPMLGRSKRFSDAGYVVPKYMLEICERSILAHIVDGFVRLDTDDDFVFVHPDDAFVVNFIKRETARAGLAADRLRLVAIGEMTAGQADTVLRAIDALETPDETPVWIFNIDTIRLPAPLPSPELLENVDGYLELFESDGDHWSFARPADPDGFRKAGFGAAVEVVEKRRISDFCSDGLYYFRNAGLFKAYAQAALEAPGDETEAFVAPLFQRMLDDGLAVACGLVAADTLHFAGTPAEFAALAGQVCPKGLHLDPETLEDRLEQEIWRTTSLGARQNEFVQLMEVLNEHVDHLDTKRLKEGVRQYFSMISAFPRMTMYFKILYDHHIQNGSSHKKLIAFLDNQLRVLINNSRQNGASTLLRTNFISAVCQLNGFRLPPSLLDPLLEVLADFDDNIVPVSVIGRTINTAHRNRDPIFETIADRFHQPKTICAGYFWFVLILSADRAKIPARLSRLRDRVAGLPVRSKSDALRSQIILTYSPTDYSRLFIRTKEESDQNGPVGFLVSGQIRNDQMLTGFIEKFRNTTPTKVFVSTWRNRGAPQVRDGLFRGYEKSMRLGLQNVCHKNRITMRAFEAKYHLVETSVVEEQEVYQRYNADSVHVEDEDDLNTVFSNNQERLFYKVRDVLKLSAESGTPSVFIRARPDLDFTADIADIEAAIEACRQNENAIFLPRHALVDFQFPFVDDNFAIAGRRAMLVYAAVFDAARTGSFKPLVTSDKNEIAAHSSLANWLIFNSVDIYSLKYRLNRYAEFMPITKMEYKAHVEKMISEQGESRPLADFLTVCAN